MTVRHRNGRRQRVITLEEKERDQYVRFTMTMPIEMRARLGDRAVYEKTSIGEIVRTFIEWGFEMEDDGK